MAGTIPRGEVGHTPASFDGQESMDHEEHEPKLFSLSEAERARRQVEPLLIEAMEGHRQMAELDEKLSAIANRILIMGGITIDYEVAARMRAEHNRTGRQGQGRARSNSGHGLRGERPRLRPGGFSLPILKNEEVYLCWRLGEDRIRFYHRQDEGFAGRKPIDPDDTGPQHPIQ